jgi:hypothetical protein
MGRVWPLAIATTRVVASASAQQSLRPIAVGDIQRLVDISAPLFAHQLRLVVHQRATVCQRNIERARLLCTVHQAIPAVISVDDEVVRLAPPV